MKPPEELRVESSEGEMGCLRDLTRHGAFTRHLSDIRRVNDLLRCPKFIHEIAGAGRHGESDLIVGTTDLLRRWTLQMQLEC